MEWHAAFGDHNYYFDVTGSLAVLLVAIAVCVLGIFWSTRQRSNVATPTRALFTLLAGLTVCLAAIPLVVIDASLNIALPGGLFPKETPWTLFRTPLLIESLVVCIPLVLLPIIGILAVRRKGGVSFAGAVVFALLSCAAVAAAQHTQLIKSDRILPQFSQTAPSWVHRNQPFELQSRLTRAESWNVDPVTTRLEGDSVIVEESARSWPFRVTHRSTIATKSEVGDARLPLRVGNRWEFTRRTVSSHGRFLYFLSTSGGQERVLPELVMHIRDAEVVKGRREFLMDVTVEERTHTVRLYAADGQTWFSDGSLALVDASEGNTSDGNGFSMRYLGECEGSAEIQSDIAVPGPCTCSAGSSRGLARALTDALVAVGTAALVVPGSTRTVLRLRRSVVGADTAPAAGIAPVEGARTPSPTCPPPQTCVVAWGYARRVRAPQLARQLERDGLGVDISIPDHRTYVTVRGDHEAVERALQVQVLHTPQEGLCPGSVVCETAVQGNVPARLSRFGVVGFKICGSE